NTRGLLLRSEYGDLPHYNRDGWETAGSWEGGKRKTRAGVKARVGKRGVSQRSAEPCWNVPDRIRGRAKTASCRVRTAHRLTQGEIASGLLVLPGLMLVWTFVRTLHQPGPHLPAPSREKPRGTRPLLFQPRSSRDAPSRQA